VATQEWHSKKLDVYAYAGAEYAGRTYGYDPYLVVPTTTAGVTTYPIVPRHVGYGSPSFNNSGCYTETLPTTGKTAGITTTAGFDPGDLAHCTGDTRAIMEGTIGFRYRFYNGPKGKFQFGTQYSYVTRQTWSGVAGTGTSGSPSGLDNMVFTSFRYYLP